MSCDFIRTSKGDVAFRSKSFLLYDVRRYLRSKRIKFVTRQRTVRVYDAVSHYRDVSRVQCGVCFALGRRPRRMRMHTHVYILIIQQLAATMRWECARDVCVLCPATGPHGRCRRDLCLIDKCGSACARIWHPEMGGILSQQMAQLQHITK